MAEPIEAECCREFGRDVITAALPLTKRTGDDPFLLSCSLSEVPVSAELYCLAPIFRRDLFWCFAVFRVASAGVRLAGVSCVSCALVARLELGVIELKRHFWFDALFC